MLIAKQPFRCLQGGTLSDLAVTHNGYSRILNSMDKIPVNKSKYNNSCCWV